MHQADLDCEIGIFRAISIEQFRPRVPRLASTCANTFGEALVHTVGNEKRFVLRPSIIAFCEPDFFIAEWIAMGCGSILLAAVYEDVHEPVAQSEQ